jgi:hypothetical protein
MVDTNADGGLDIQELYSLSKRGQQAQSNDASTEAGGG